MSIKSNIDPNEPCWYGDDDEVRENSWDYEHDPYEDDHIAADDE